MRPTVSLVSGLTLLLTTLGAACAPSSNPGRAPRAGADSATEASEEQQPEATPIAPDQTADPAPEESPPPRPRVAVRPIPLPRPAGPYTVRIVDESQHDLPRFASAGRTYVMGTVGSRYSIVIANPTSRRVEVVLSIDGLDAMDGHPANFVEKRGYILPAHGDATIDGFRTSVEDVATFRFSSVADSYAGRLGQARDVGVIGVAFFPERAPPVAVWQPPALPRDVAPHARAMPSRPSPALDDLAESSSSSALAGGGASPTAQSAPSTAAGAGAGGADEAPKKRPGLGTEFGEARESRIEMTEFTRANPSHPSQLVSIRYNDRAGLVALGVVPTRPYVAVETDLRLRESADPFRQNRFAQPPP